MALSFSGVEFRKPWTPPQLAAYEGPFTGAEKRLPQYPMVAAERREEKRAREAAKLAAECNKAAGHDIAA